MKRKIDENIIYEAALKNFARYGYRKTSLDDIASELEMTKGNLYRYSNNKQSLYQESIRYALYKWLENVERAIGKEAEAEQRLKVMCEKSIEYLNVNPEISDLMREDEKIMSPLLKTDIYEDIYEDSRNFIAGILEYGVAQGAFRADLEVGKISEIIYTLYQVFLMMAYREGQEKYVTDFYVSTIELLLNGLKTK